MLPILFTILKIIGFLLLILLCLFLFLLLSILFVPVRYKAIGEKKDDIFVHVRASWFLHLFTFIIDFEDSKLSYGVRLFGIRLRRFDSDYEKKEKPKKQDKNQKSKLNKTNIESDKEFDSQPNLELNKETIVKTKENKEDIDKNIIDKPQEFITRKKPTVEKEKEFDDLSFFQKWKRFFLSLIKKLINIKYTLKNIYDKIIEIRDNFTFYRDLILLERTKQLYTDVLKQVGRLLRHIRPRKVRMHITLGMGDPASTGEAIAAFSIIYPFIGKSITLTPRFDEEILEGDFYFRGYSQVFVLLHVVSKVYFNKELRNFMKVLRKEA
ncbi:MAG: DUF2953 domain-containing protein [Lachnospiraceae bacterium]|nr:DUF2953 domain-containing protein [Lachnospiraceae bacterium]